MRARAGAENARSECFSRTPERVLSCTRLSKPGLSPLCHNLLSVFASCLLSVCPSLLLQPGAGCARGVRGGDKMYACMSCVCMSVCLCVSVCLCDWLCKARRSEQDEQRERVCKAMRSEQDEQARRRAPVSVSCACVVSQCLCRVPVSCLCVVCMCGVYVWRASVSHWCVTCVSTRVSRACGQVREEER